MFGDVWYVAAPAGKFEIPEVKPSGQVVRMIENQSKRDGKDAPSRFSVCVSRTPRIKEANGKWSNRFASYWKDAEQDERADQKLDRARLPQRRPEPDGRL